MPTAPTRVSVAARLDPDQAAALDRYAADRGFTRSAALAELLELGLAAASADALVEKIDERFERQVELGEVLAIVHDDVRQIREALGLLSPAPEGDDASRADLDTQITAGREQT